MNAHKTPPQPELRRLQRLVIAVALLWTLMVAASLAWNISEKQRETRQLAEIEARSHFQKDLVFRRWMTSHGGVYLPVEPGRVEAIPYLAAVPERDVTTLSGRRLTLVDPALMLKQMMQEYGDAYGPRARIFGPQPFNPENLPDPWERAALDAFRRGAPEVLSETRADGRRFLRLMGPMHALPGCAKCHKQPDYRPGNVVGGVGVLLPLEPYLHTQSHVIFALTLTHGGIWLATLGAIGVVGRRSRRHILERQADQQALRDSETRIRMLLDSTAEAIYGVDRDGVCTFCNPACLRMLGYREESELVGRNLHPLMHHTRPDGTPYAESDCAIHSVRRTGSPVHRDDEVFFRADGSAFPVEYWSHPIRRDGEMVGAVVTFVDVTPRKQAELALRQFNAQLEQRVAARTRELTGAIREMEAFSYSVSHDLRAPLRSIDGFTHLIQEEFGERLDDEGRGYLRRVRAAAQRMGAMIDAMLELSRLSRHELDIAEVDLSGIASECARELAEHDPQRRCEFILQPGVRGHGDPVLLKIVLQNLFDNAWKFSSERKVARIEFGLWQQDGARAYFVRDNGVGFDMAYAGQLFGAFRRLHSAERFPGSGIGLASIARIIHRHGGKVWAESRPDDGAGFYFTLGETPR